MFTEQFLLGVLIVVNVFSFVVMGNDKRKSIQSRNPERTPEGILFFLAGAFGATGIYLGMFTFRHKTQKWYFQLGIPLLVFQNLSAVYVLMWSLGLNIDVF